MNLAEQTLNVLSREARAGVGEMVRGGLASGAPLPCPQHIVEDLASHAIEQTLRTFTDHVSRAAREGEGTDLVVMLLAINYLWSSFGTVREVIAAQVMRAQR